MARITKDNLIFEYKKFFLKEYNSNPEIISAAPGRVNIIGEHTDYNQGLAIPAAIDKWIITLLSRRDDSYINVYSINYKKRKKFNFNELDASEELWERYIKATLFVIKSEYNLELGFNFLIGGNIPIGFGMSSSAALEVSIVSSILSLCSLDYDNYKILKICNIVEKEILGINSGMLDQYASIFSVKNKFLLIDFSKIEHQYFKNDIQGSSWILINSMVKRNLIDSEYNNRVDECREGIDLINKKTKYNISLNSISIKDLDYIKKQKNIYNRLFHVINENHRVRQMKNELVKGDLNKIGDLLNQSHHSLSNYFEVSCKEIESIIQFSKNHSAFYGGRIMGGGFGGSTINLIDNNLKNEFIAYVKSEFYNEYNYKIEIEEVCFADGLEFVTI